MSTNADKATRIDRYELVDHDDGTFHVRMVADNGQVIFWTENYTSKAAAMEAIRLVRLATHDRTGDDERTIQMSYSEIIPIERVYE